MTRRRGVVLDAGAFIALERRDRVVVHLVRRFAEEQIPLVTSAGVVAQVWRDGAGPQAPIAFLLRRTEVIDLTSAIAKRLGRMLGLTRTTDPIDAHVVWLARERQWPVVSSDRADLLALDPHLDVVAI
ncbi:MAG: hypothetical protein M3Y87_00505 [Myxococcota bacterium]|nr:hypothetical protein [Myxococcota bacterium]